MKSFIRKMFGMTDQSAEIESLRAELSRKESMVERQLRMCVALTKLEVLVKRTGTLKIQRNKKGSGLVIASTANGVVSMSGPTLEQALTPGRRAAA